MPTLSVGNDIVFHYTDSGPIENTEYATLVFVHGLTFHTGVFKRILPLAASHSLRVICVSRREYEGSTPYSTDELKVINHGSTTERTDLLREQGVLLALFIDRLIQTLLLPEKGGVTVAGWSMGNIFTIAMRASIDYLPDDTKQRLKAYARGFIIYDPPCQALGIPLPPDGYLPLIDANIPEEARGPAFAKWVSSYFNHGNLSSRDFSQMEQREGNTPKPPTISNLPIAEVADFAPAVKCEAFIVDSQYFSSIFVDQTTKALFDPRIRENWGGQPVWFVYGDASIWVALYAAWELEKQDKTLEIKFKVVQGANHFLMWDEPDRFMSIMKECLPA